MYYLWKKGKREIVKLPAVVCPNKEECYTGFFTVLIPMNVTNVTCRGCYHFRWSESLHNQNKSWFFVNSWDDCKIRDS